MLKTYGYLVRPKEHLKTMVSNTDIREWSGLTSPVLWLRDESDMDTSLAEDRIALVKLIFLGSLKAYLEEDNIVAIFGNNFEISTDIFDDHWHVDRYRAGSFVEIELSSLPDEVLEQFRPTHTAVDRWITDYVKQRSTEIET